MSGKATPYWHQCFRARSPPCSIDISFSGYFHVSQLGFRSDLLQHAGVFACWAVVPVLLSIIVSKVVAVLALSALAPIGGVGACVKTHPTPLVLHVTWPVATLARHVAISRHEAKWFRSSAGHAYMEQKWTGRACFPGAVPHPGQRQGRHATHELQTG